MSSLSHLEIKEELKNLPKWIYESDELSKQFKFKDFKEALVFLVRVGLEAESHAHHPTIFNVYNKVKIGLQTHDAGNKVTKKDIELAVAIESIL